MFRLNLRQTGLYCRTRIGKLKILKYLNLHGNAITSLQEEIGQLTQLQILIVLKNKLTALPLSIAKLNQLQVLDIESNVIDSLPTTFAQLTHLKCLRFSKNSFVQSPQSISNFPELAALEIACNKLNALPVAVNLPLLKKLDISHNEIKEVPNTWTVLGNIQEINAEYNQISHLPTQISDGKQLTALIFRITRFNRCLHQ